MAVQLTKGGKVSLGKESEAAGGKPTIQVGKFGLKWDINPAKYGSATADFDLDRFCILLGEDGKPVFGDKSLIFYNNPTDPSGCVEMSPDNRTGAGDGYDEVGTITFAKVPATVKEVIIGVAVYEFEARKQNFGQIKAAAIDVINGDDGNVLTHTDLEEDLSMETGAIVGRFRQEADGTWSFKALADTYRGGMQEILTKYGIAF